MKNLIIDNIENSLVAVSLGIFSRCIVDFIARRSSTFAPAAKVVDKHRGGDDDNDAHQH